MIAQPGSTTAPGRGSSSGTISSTVTIDRAEASTTSFWTPVIPQSWTLPRSSACCAWTIPTSGRIAGTAESLSPVNGQSIRRDPRARLEIGARGSPAAPRTAGSPRLPRRPPPSRHASAPRARAAPASRARPRRGSDAASRRPGFRPTRRSASARSRPRSSGRRRCRASSARASGRGAPAARSRARRHSGSGA